MVGFRINDVMVPPALYVYIYICICMHTYNVPITANHSFHDSSKVCERCNRLMVYPKIDNITLQVAKNPVTLGE